MSAAKGAIFAKIGRARASKGTTENPQADWKATFQAAQRTRIPQCAQSEGDARLQQFCERALKFECSVDVISNEGEIPSAVSDYLAQRQLAPEIFVTPSSGFSDLIQGTETTLQLQEASEIRAADGGVTLTECVAGLAEEGVIVTRSNETLDQGLALISMTHIVVVHADQVFGGFEELWDHVRAVYPDDEMPRAINVIGGPSRTGDIEGTSVLGAHGPGALHILLVSPNFVLE